MGRSLVIPMAPRSAFGPKLAVKKFHIALISDKEQFCKKLFAQLQDFLKKLEIRIYPIWRGGGAEGGTKMDYVS